MRFSYHILSLGVLILCSGLLLTFSHCTQDITADSNKVVGQKKVPAVKIAPLLERSGKIALLNEWEGIRTTAIDLKNKINHNPKDIKSILYLSALYMQEARITGEHPYYYPAAMTLLDHAIEHSPKDPIEWKFQALTSKASVCLSQHQFKEALQLGKKALALENKDAQVYGILCDANVELGNYGEAVKMADKMVKIRPDLRSYARISYLRELHGDYKGAVEAMDLAIAAGIPGRESTTWCRTTLGNIHLEYGRLAEAEKQFQMALAEREDFGFALEGLGKVAEAKGDLKTAMAKYKAAEKSIPEFSFTQAQARIHLAENETQKATKIAKELEKMFAEDQESGHNMNLEVAAMHMELTKDYKAALTYAQKENAIRPENITVAKTMAEVQYNLGNYTAAYEHIQKALATKISQPEMLCLAGLIFHKKGETELAKTMIKSAFEQNPKPMTDLAKEAAIILKS